VDRGQGFRRPLPAGALRSTTCDGSGPASTQASTWWRLGERPDLLLLADKGYLSAELDEYLYARGADLLHRD
jgi:hypothetical protein